MVKMKTIGEFDVSDTMRLKLQTGEYNGDLRVDLRMFIKVDNEFKPTKKGINFHAEWIDKFIEMVKKLEDT